MQNKTPYDWYSIRGFHKYSRWNTNRNSYGPGPGPGPAPPPPPPPPPATPVNTVAPVISGSTSEGSILNTNNGTWTGALPITFTYQWYRVNTAITNATSANYTTQNVDIGSAITCKVTGTNTEGSSTATSSNSITPVPSPSMVACGNSGVGGETIAYSSDGITWTASTNGTSIFTSSCNYVAWNGSIWVAGGNGTNSIATSPDGMTWTASTNGNSIFTNSCNGVAWAGSKWVAVGQGTNNSIATSPDGMTWTASTNIFNGNAFCVASEVSNYPPY